MNALAEELNSVLAPLAAGRLLSDMGRRMYYPKGLLTQSAEADAKAKRYNATIGMAYEHGDPLMLDALRAALPGLTPREAVAYAPTGGVMALRQRWKKAMEEKNPSLRGASYSLPMVVPGLTAAISYVCDMFLDPEDRVVVPDLHWPNYKMIVEDRKFAAGLAFPLFSEGGFNVKGLEARMREAGERRGKAICVLNFPNNPVGYTPTLKEADEIVAAMTRLADSGMDVLVISDDAYFGLRYESGLLEESIFARLAAAHERILAVKADGPTKEDYVWGFRVGFVTFAGKSLGAAAQEALTKKLMGVIRTSVSSSSSVGQNLLLKALDAPGYEEQKAHYRALLEGRYHAFRRALEEVDFPAGLRALPFNSGYFMSFEVEGASAEAIRVSLIDGDQIGIISMQDKYLRIAFSSVEEADVRSLCEYIARRAREAGVR